MDLKSFLSPMSHEDRDEFAQRCGTTKGHMQNVMYGLKSCATDLAVNVERESAGVVMRWDLREDWTNHWPELLNHPDAPPAQPLKEAA